MKSIRLIRKHLGQITGALYELEPEIVNRGNVSGIETLWHPDRDNNDRTLAEYWSEDDEPSETGAELEPIFEIAPQADRDKKIPVLSGDQKEKIRKSINLEGVDALAWYVTFHAKGIQWGIYVPISSLIYLGELLFGSLTDKLEVKIGLAFKSLHSHELFHFSTDYMASQWEAITSLPCHKPARALRDQELGYNISEECLANAHMLRSIRNTSRVMNLRGKTDRLRKFVEMQPPGYRNASQIVARDKFMKSCEELSKSYAKQIQGYNCPHLDAVDHVQLYCLMPKIDWTFCPIHIIHNEDEFNIPRVLVSLFSQISNVQETDQFKKAFQRLSGMLQQKWLRAKEMLAVNIQRGGLDFKLWESTREYLIYSLRLNKGYRVHLKYEKSEKTWWAVDIGPHKSMGHG